MSICHPALSRGGISSLRRLDMKMWAVYKPPKPLQTRLSLPSFTDPIANEHLSRAYGVPFHPIVGRADGRCIYFAVAVTCLELDHPSAFVIVS
jgi:hypothetical protein